MSVAISPHTPSCKPTESSSGEAFSLSFGQFLGKIKARNCGKDIFRVSVYQGHSRPAGKQKNQSYQTLLIYLLSIPYFFTKVTKNQDFDAIKNKEKARFFDLAFYSFYYFSLKMTRPSCL